MNAKEALFNSLKEFVTSAQPICLSIDCSDNQSLIVAIRSGIQEWQAIDPACVNTDKLCVWLTDKGFRLASRPLLVGGYKYWIFTHTDDMSNEMINAKRLRESAEAHDQTSIKVPESKDLFDLLSAADPACNQITLVVQINFSRIYTLDQIRYHGQKMMDIPTPIRLSQAIFDATLRSAGWSMVGLPSHQRGMNRVGDQLVANEYHYILQRGSAGVVNQLNKSTDLQEHKGHQDRMAFIGQAFASGKLNGVPAQAQRSIVNDPAKLSELEAIRDL